MGQYKAGIWDEVQNDNCDEDIEDGECDMDEESDDDGNNYCDTCDKSFSNRECYMTHCAEHMTCRLEGCTFTAHPKIVTKHIQMQHATGLFHRIVNSDTPQDIAKWIEERKRNYPTPANIERKQQEAIEKCKRRECLSVLRSGRGGRGRRTGQVNTRQPLNKGATRESESSRRSRSSRKRNRTRKPKTFQIGLDCGKLSAFQGLNFIYGANHTFDDVDLSCKAKDIVFTDSEGEENTRGKLVQQKPIESIVLPSCLGLLACSYNTDEDSNEECNTNNIILDIKVEDHIIKLKPLTQESPNVRLETEPVKMEVKPHLQEQPNEDDATKENVDPMEVEELLYETDQEEDIARYSVADDISSVLRYPKWYKRRPYYKKPLLEKLLSREIEHERNVVLQCIHFIIEKNFFKETS